MPLDVIKKPAVNCVLWRTLVAVFIYSWDNGGVVDHQHGSIPAEGGGWPNYSRLQGAGLPKRFLTSHFVFILNISKTDVECFLSPVTL